MSAPLVLILASLLTAFIAVFARNQRSTAALVSASGAALIAVFVLFTPFDTAIPIMGFSIRFDNQWVILGRSLNLDQSIRPMIGFLYLSGLYLFSGSWVLILNRYFPSIAILMLMTVAGSIMVEPFLFAAAFIGLAAMGSVLLLVSPQNPRSKGAVRMMVLYTFAILTILLSGWMLETGSGTGAAATEGVRAAVVLLFGFAILMAIPPFHIWLISSVEDSNPYILAFVAVVLQGAGFFLLMRFLDTYSWLRLDPIFGPGLSVISMYTMILASLWAISTQDLRKVFAYVVIADMGVILLALSNANPQGSRVALALFGSRVFAISILALCLSLISPGRVGWRGVGRDQPLIAAGILLGLLSLAGFPLTAGFPGRWAMLSFGIQESPWILVALLSTISILALVALRWATIFFDPTSYTEARETSIFQQIYIILGIATLFILGIAPQILLPWVVEVAAGLTNLFP